MTDRDTPSCSHSVRSTSRAPGSNVPLTIAWRMRSRASSRSVTGGLSILSESIAMSRAVMGVHPYRSMSPERTLASDRQLVYHHITFQTEGRTMAIELRKTLLHVETTFIEGGRQAA